MVLGCVFVGDRASVCFCLERQLQMPFPALALQDSVDLVDFRQKRERVVAHEHCLILVDVEPPVSHGLLAERKYADKQIGVIFGRCGCLAGRGFWRGCLLLR